MQHFCIVRAPRRPHPRHADLVDDIRECMADIGKSARWFGITVASDPRLVPGLIRGQTYSREVMRAIYTRLLAIHGAEIAKLEAKIATEKRDYVLAA